jgi:hypothetical protein
MKIYEKSTNFFSGKSPNKIIISDLSIVLIGSLSRKTEPVKCDKTVIIVDINSKRIDAICT